MAVANDQAFGRDNMKPMKLMEVLWIRKMTMDMDINR